MYRLVPVVLFFLLHQPVFAQDDSASVHRTLAGAWKMRSSDLDSAIRMTRTVIQKVRAGGTGWAGAAEAKAYYYLGNFYSSKGDLEKGRTYFSQALEIAEKNNDTHNISLINGGYGNFYLNQGNFPKALEYFFRALSIDEKRGYKEGIAVRLSNIGTVYDSQGETDKALSYYMRALEKFNALRDSSHLSILLGNIGIIHYTQKDVEKARKYFNESLAIDRAQANKNGISRNLNNIGSICQESKDFKTARACFDEGLLLAKEQGNLDLVSSHTGNLGVLARLTGDHNASISKLKEAIAISKEIGSTEAESEFERELSDTYVQKGDHKEAFAHFKKHIDARDSIFNQQNTEKIVRLEMNYDFDKRQAIEKAKHEEEVLLLEAENRRQKQVWILLSVICALTLVILLVLKRAYDNKKRLAEFLAAESDHKEALLQEVHHRINNNFQIISSLLTMQGNSPGEEHLRAILDQNQGRIHSVATLHELLYRNDTLLDINMMDYLDKVVDFHRELLKAKDMDIKIETRVSPVVFSTRVAVPIALIVNELITNSLKYAFSPGDTGSIKVSLEKAGAKGTEWRLQIADSGKGMGDSPRANSMGLRLVKMMARQLKAEMRQGDGRGTSYQFIFKAKEKSPETVVV
jgi:two-component system, sensor histidine kinase PdtaS